MAATNKTSSSRRSAPTRARTIPAKYIFLDIVGFTHNRSVEAQTEIVGVFNSIIKISVKRISKKNLLLLPTGDGVCIVFLNVEDPYDIHLQVALDILRSVEGHNESTQDAMRQFQVRVGINANVDNLVVDVNGRTNIAGAGINLAQRVMNAGDGNQILVGQPVFETLIQREKYLKSFRSYTTQVKHQINLPVHQYIPASHPGLNTDVPSQFRVGTREKPKLTKLAAYYLAQAIANREFLKTKTGVGQDPYGAMVLLYFLATDSLGKSEESDIRRYKPRIWDPNRTLEEQFQYYNSIEFWVCCDMAGLIVDKYLEDYAECFVDSGVLGHLFVTEGGITKLKQEWPSIWNESGLAKGTEPRGS